jgi:hypothetical protein
MTSIDIVGESYGVSGGSLHCSFARRRLLFEQINENKSACQIKPCEPAR